MRNFFDRYTPLVLTCVIWLLIFLGVSLRAYNADLFPIDNNDDGLFYVWAGTSFIKNPRAVESLSIFDSSNTALLWRSQYFDYVPHLRFGMKIIQPWFDHPPFGAVLISLPAYFLGFTQIEQIPHLVVRYTAIIASIITLFLTYQLAKKTTTTRIALFSLFSMATVSYFVFAHRQAYLENILTPLFLTAAVSYLKYSQTKNKKFLFLSALTAFLCGWVKIPAFSVPLMFLAWAVYSKDWYGAKVLALTFLLSVSSYFLYGYTSDRIIFAQTLQNQGVRGMYLTSFLENFTRPQFYGDFKDGQYVLGLLCIVSFLLKKDKTPKELFISWLVLCWMFVLFLVSGKNNNSAWYKYPLIPFMSIGLGWGMDELFEHKNIFFALLFVLFGLTSFDLAGVSFNTSLLRLSIIALFMPFVLHLLFPKHSLIEQLSKYSVIILFSVIFIGNLLVIKNYPFLRCLNEDCLLPTKVILEQK